MIYPIVKQDPVEVAKGKGIKKVYPLRFEGTTIIYSSLRDWNLGSLRDWNLGRVEDINQIKKDLPRFEAEGIEVILQADERVLKEIRKFVFMGDRLKPLTSKERDYIKKN